MRQKIIMNHKCTYCIINKFEKILLVLSFIILIIFAGTICVDVRNLRRNYLPLEASCHGIDFFAFTLTMDAIIVAIIVFLYSRYKENVFGVPIEYIVKYMIGDFYITIYKIMIFIIPCISFACEIIGLQYMGLACVFSMYLIVGIFSYVTTGIMRRDVVKFIIKNQLSDEMEERVRIFQNSKILTPTVDGYRKEKSIERDVCFHEKLRGKLIEMIFQTQCSEQELSEIVEEIFSTIISDKNKCPVIGFVFTYDLALGILNRDMEEESYYYWNLKLLERLVYTLDQALYQLKERKNKFKYEKGEEQQHISKLNSIKEYEKVLEYENYYLDIYIALIYALLIKRNKAAEKFLWEDFYANSKHRDSELTKKMFIATVLYIQVLLVKNYKNFDLFFELIKNDTDSFRRAFIDYKNMLNLSKYGFIISHIGICSQSEAVAVLESVEQDLNHVCEKGYIPNTVFLSFLNRRENWDGL